MKHSVWFYAFMGLLAILVGAILVPNRWIEAVTLKEDQMVLDAMGEHELHKVRSRAQRWYQSGVEESGLGEAVRFFFFPPDEQSPAMQQLGRVWFEWLEGRAEALVKVLHQVLTRLAILLSWLPAIAAMILPSMWDGMMTRQIRQSNFDYPSPFIHRYAGLIILAMVFALSAGLFVPVPVPPFVLPALAMVASSLFGVFFVANLPKRL